jgi:hypothetical protein
MSLRPITLTVPSRLATALYLVPAALALLIPLLVVLTLYYSLSYRVSVVVFLPL